MKRTLNALAITMLLALLTTVAGCVKYKQVITLMPDGSGKIDVDFALSEQMIQLGQQQGDDPFKQMTPATLAEGSEGIVAFTQPKKQKKDGYTSLSFTAYFNDINQVKLGGMEDEDDADPPMTFAYKRDGRSATLTARDTMTLDVARTYEPLSEEQKAQGAAKMLDGIYFNETFVLPGESDAVKGVTMVDNTAKIEITEDNILNATGPLMKIKGKEQFVFKIGEVQEDDQALKAFQAEMAEAVKAWEQMKKQAAEE